MADHPPRPTLQRYRPPVAAAAALVVFLRMSGLRGEGEAPDWIWPGPLLDVLTVTTLTVIATALLTSENGVPALVARGGRSWLPAIAGLCVGGGAMAGVMATAIGDWALGLQLTAVMTGLLVTACVLGALFVSLCVATAVGFGALLERHTRPSPPAP